jgi:sigma-B regulation protein RsbU (phosphoserine phosphatase)
MKLTTFNDRGITFKLISMILLGCALVFSVVMYYNYRYSSRIILKDVEQIATNLARSRLHKIEAILGSVEKIPGNMVYMLEYSMPDRESLYKVLSLVVENNSEIYGSAIAFEPYSFDRGKYYFSPYAHREGSKTAIVFLGGDNYKYFEMPWYSQPKETGRGVWSEPYFDEGGGNILMSTYSSPFYGTSGGAGKSGNKRVFRGVMTADVSLHWLKDIVSSIKIFKSGYGFLISRNGTFVTHPNANLIMKTTIQSLAQARGDKKLEAAGQAMLAGKSGFVPIEGLDSDEDSWLYYAPLSVQGWSLGVVFPDRELMEGINALTRAVFLLGLGGLIFLAAIIASISASITRPLKGLTKAAGIIASGDLDAPVPAYESKDEIGRLAASFEHMKAALKEYIRELTETTAVRERIESELNIAREIQMGILPKTFPPFPERPEFDIYASIRPAREVGGDFYDFFFLDESHLCLVIADVSGKGVPASLFMAVTRTLIKADSSVGARPEGILARVNSDLCYENEATMFVTVFCGILDTRSGVFDYASGGHNPPYLLRAGAEEAERLTADGIALGVLEGAEFLGGSAQLAAEDLIFFYTDGVTEAINKADEEFGEERLQDTLQRMRTRPLGELSAEIIASIDAFADGEPQFDDITIMAMRVARIDNSPTA